MDKTAIVTGGYSGIGLETTRVLAGAGADVVVPARNMQKAQDALAGIPGKVLTTELDLCELTSVRNFARKMLESLERLDILINNAGIMACPLARVGPGWESQFGVNHMGHFALTCELMPLLARTSGARVVVLSSAGHKITDIRWDDMHFSYCEYDKWQAYGQAKTANALFANALARRLSSSGGAAFSVHPGGIFTPLQRHLSQQEMIHLGWLNSCGEPSELAKQGFKTPLQGCSTTVWAATSEQLTGKPGVYCEDCDIAMPTDTCSDHARFVGVDDHACSDESAEKLWELSTTMLERA